MPICIILEHKDYANFVKSVVLLSPILVVQVHMVKKCVVTFERDGVFWCVALRGYALFLLAKYGMEEKKTCCFFGHRKVADTDTEQLRKRLYEIIEELIIYNNVSVFLFGSRSDFDRLCREVVAELKEKHPHIHRIYIRAEYQYINDSYEKYLLGSCDETYYSERAVNAGRAVYVERNRDMIDKSEICVVYYKDGCLPPRRKNSRRDLTDYQPKSGTQIAYEYAQKKKKVVIQTADF